MLKLNNSTVLYVSQSIGNDDNSGLEPINTNSAEVIGPFKTIQKALQTVEMIRNAGVMQPLTIKIDGEYLADSVIKINNTVSDLTITSYEGIRAKIIGGKRIQGFTESEVNGKRCFVAVVPEVKQGKWTFSDLFVNGKRARLSRFPKNAEFKAITTEFPYRNPVDNATLHNGSKWFIAHKEDLNEIADIENAIISFKHYWVDEHTPVDNYDKKTGRVDLKYRTRFEITADYENNQPSDLHYYLENVYEGLNEPNDFYLDIKNGMLYYIPADNTMTANDIEVVAPVTDKIFEIEGKSDSQVFDIKIKDLDISITKGDYASFDRAENGEITYYASDSQSMCNAYGAINFKYANNCSIEDCSIENVGLYGVSIDFGSSDIKILRNKIIGMGAGGIRVFGTEKKNACCDKVSHCKIIGNLIKGCGQRYVAGCGVIIGNASYCELSDNEICEINYSGVSVGWSWGYDDSETHHNEIRNNYIHHIGQGELSDLGGIYLLGKQHGTVIEGNIIHTVNCRNYGGWGMYLDEGTSYVRITRNVIFDTQCECVNQHFGSYNILSNNVFIADRKGILSMTSKNSFMSPILNNNIMIVKGCPIYSCLAYYYVVSRDNAIWDIKSEKVIMFENYDLKQFQARFGLEENTREEKRVVNTDEIIAHWKKNFDLNNGRNDL